MSHIDGAIRTNLESRLKLPRLHYTPAQNKPYTFQDPKVRQFVESRLTGRVLNLFAGKTILDYPGEKIRVDLDTEMPQLNFVGCASNYLINTKLTFDTIIYDPPWNERKSKEKYEGRMIGKYTRHKDLIVSKLNTNGQIISAGYEISNFGEIRGMGLTDILICNPFGEFRPFFVTVEKKRNANFEDYFIVEDGA